MLEYQPSIVQTESVGPSESRVLLNLPGVATPALYPNFTITYRRLPSSPSQSFTVPSSSPIFSLPGTFGDGERYELLVTLIGTFQNFVNIPVIFTTRSSGEEENMVLLVTLPNTFFRFKDQLWAVIFPLSKTVEATNSSHVIGAMFLKLVWYCWSGCGSFLCGIVCLVA